ncbi:alpha/beta hydrolase [Salinirarus marinus]|uniref:alpha/beta hydrolase n=1 Tax=Salinirarus marinus TaxID=3068310 RepID=UPI003C6CBF26
MSPRAVDRLRTALRRRLAPPPETSLAAYACVRGARLLGELSDGGGDTSVPGVTVRDRTIRGSDADVPVRWYRPPGDADRRPVTIFLHGGGWITGGLDTNQRLCASLARETGRTVVAVDYRLAPEHRHPAALRDCEHVLDWIDANGPAHGLDTDSVRLFGASAGGTLAAALHSDPAAAPSLPVEQQTLVYPPLDPAFDARRRSVGPLRRASRPLIEALWDLYLPPDADRTTPRVAPLRTTRFDAVPPTTVVTCGFDPLRAEGRAYARALAAAEVPVAHVDFPRFPHGALTLLPRISRARTVAVLRRILAASPTG